MKLIGAEDERMADLGDQYADLRLATTTAAVIALALMPGRSYFRSEPTQHWSTSPGLWAKGRAVSISG